MTESVEDYAKRVADEYGQFRAKQVIFHDGIRAYNVGDPVPASNVKAHGYEKDGLVEKVKKSDGEPGVAASIRSEPPAPATA